MNVSLQQIAAWVGGTASGDATIHEVVTDSRRPMGAGALFVALSGPHFDGHVYAPMAYERGAVAALVSRPVEGPHVLVDDTLDALQKFATAWRSRWEIPVVGITGSNGKTIVKEMLATLLSRKYTVWRSPGSFNSQVGVALSLLGIRSDHDVALIEAGISEFGEMAKLEAMIQPNIGILVTVGNAHLKGLKNHENIVAEKSKLFARAEHIFAPEAQRALIEDHADSGVDRHRITWVPAAHQVEMDHDGARFRVEFEGVPCEFRLNALGEHNVANAAMALRVAANLGVASTDLQQALAAYELAPMRLEIHTTQSGITLINDAYSSDPVSARGAIATLQQYAGGARTVAIVGDMLDLGGRSKAAHTELGRVIGRAGVAILVTLGESAKGVALAAVSVGMPEAQVHTCDSLEDLSDVLELLLEPGDVVLFKGSRAMGLERAAERLLESVAPTRLHINLDAIRGNVAAIREAIGADTKLMAVVKSFAYGNDATRVSQTLVREGIDWLGVAYADEAIPLRRRGLRVPILVTNTLAAEADKIVKYGLTGLVYSEHVVRSLDEHAQRRGVVVDVHMEVDTGMGRVGVAPGDALALARAIRQYPHVRLTGLMTHFSSADDAEEDAYTRAQIAAFESVRAQLEADGFELSCVHAANTAAAWRFPDSRFDLVRVGLGLYGFHPSDDVAIATHATQAALRFSTRIIHLKDVAADTSISYNRRWKSPEPRRIATIAVGYNDGFGRFMSNGGHVLVRGVRCEVVGSVCMDVCMVDVTRVPEVALDDEVVLFGEQNGAFLAVEEMAKRGNTINYEILCKISPRVRRIFVRQET